MRSIKARQSGAAGFSLVELVMTLAITAVVALPVATLIVQQMETVGVSQDSSAAFNFARLEMERIQNMPYDQITSLVQPDYMGGPYDVIRTVTYAFGNAGSAESLKQIRVEVRPAGGNTALVIFLTYIARNVSYGV